MHQRLLSAKASKRPWEQVATKTSERAQKCQWVGGHKNGGHKIRRAGMRMGKHDNKWPGMEWMTQRMGGLVQTWAGKSLAGLKKLLKRVGRP